MALSAAFSIIMIMIGVARTGGNMASLKRLARWSGVTTRTNEPLAPTGIGRMDCLKFYGRNALPLSGWILRYISEVIP